MTHPSGGDVGSDSLSTLYDEREDERLRACVCSGFGRANFVHPFEPSPHVAWHRLADSARTASAHAADAGAGDAATSGLFGRTATGAFSEAVVEDEYRRYAYRDVSGSLQAGIYLLGPLFVPLGIAQNSYLVLPLTIYALLTAVPWVMDLWLHFVAPLTQRNARRRQILWVVLAAMLVPANAFINWHTQSHCADGRAYVNGTRSDPKIACENTIDPYVLMLSAIVFANFKVPVIPAVVLSVFIVVLAGLGRLLPDTSRSETPAELGVKLMFFTAGGVLAVTFLAVKDAGARLSFVQVLCATIERQKSQQAADDVDSMLCALVPMEVLPRVMSRDPGLAATVDAARGATVLFSDIVGFTSWSAPRAAAAVVEMLNALCIEFDAAAVDRGVEKVSTIGDAYWAMSGLPSECLEHASRMVDLARDMLQHLQRANLRHPEWDGSRFASACTAARSAPRCWARSSGATNASAPPTPSPVSSSSTASLGTSA